MACAHILASAEVAKTGVASTAGGTSAKVIGQEIARMALFQVKLRPGLNRDHLDWPGDPKDLLPENLVVPAGTAEFETQAVVATENAAHKAIDSRAGGNLSIPFDHWDPSRSVSTKFDVVIIRIDIMPPLAKILKTPAGAE